MQKGMVMAKKANEQVETKQFEYMDPFTVEEFEDSFTYDGDEFEQLCDERRKEFAQYLSEFENDLIALGLKDPTIDRHYRNLDFYLNTYLLRIAPLDVRAGCYKIGDFLGNFFIRKCMWSTPESIKSNCASFKKFYKSMLDHGHVSQSDYGYVCQIIKEDKQEWCDLCAEFNDPYSENPFSPFPSSPSFDGGFQDAFADSSFGPGQFDDVELSPEEYEAMAKAVQELIAVLEARGMTHEEILEYLDGAMDASIRGSELDDMPDENLLGIVGRLGIETDRDELSDIMRVSVSAVEVADAVCDEAHVELDESGFNELVLCIEILWYRWLPEEPSDIVLIMGVADGYYLREAQLEEDVEDEVLEGWQTAWDALKRIVRVGGLEIIPFDEPIVEMHSISEWIDDFGEALKKAAEKTPDLQEAYERFVSERDEMLRG